MIKTNTLIRHGKIGATNNPRNEKEKIRNKDFQQDPPLPLTLVCVCRVQSHPRRTFQAVHVCEEQTCCFLEFFALLLSLLPIISQFCFPCDVCAKRGSWVAFGSNASQMLMCVWITKESITMQRVCMCEYVWLCTPTCIQALVCEWCVCMCGWACACVCTHKHVWRPDEDFQCLASSLSTLLLWNGGPYWIRSQAGCSHPIPIYHSTETIWLDMATHDFLCGGWRPKFRSSCLCCSVLTHQTSPFRLSTHTVLFYLSLWICQPFFILYADFHLFSPLLFPLWTTPQ